MISNAAEGGTPKQVRYLAAQGCTAPLCTLLTFGCAKTIRMALIGTERFMTMGSTTIDLTQEVLDADGVHFLRELTEPAHEDADICLRVCTILDSYFLDANGEILGELHH